MSGDTLILNADGLPVSVLPVSTLLWQDAIKSIWLQSVKPLAYYDDWIVHSPRIEMRVPSVVITEKYIKTTRAVRFTVSNIFLRDEYRCQYCAKHFPEGELTVDHVKPRSFGGRSSWENLATACSPCNNRRGNDYRIQPLTKPHKPNYYEMVDRRRKFPLEVPHESWVEFLMWPEDNIVVKKHLRRKKT